MKLLFFRKEEYQAVVVVLGYGVQETGHLIGENTLTIETEKSATALFVSIPTKH